MSLFIKRFDPKQIAKAYRVLSTTQATATHFEWFPDVKPGPYPRTKEEREAAARKYNLLPEEYEPIPEESGVSCGDYPDIPKDSVDSKDPWYPWDNPELRRNYNDPLPKNIMILIPEAYSTAPEPIDPVKGTLIFFGLITLFGTLFYYMKKFEILIPLMEEQKVTPGAVHYTFDLVGDDDEKHHH